MFKELFLSVALSSCFGVTSLVQQNYDQEEEHIQHVNRLNFSVSDWNYLPSNFVNYRQNNLIGLNAVNAVLYFSDTFNVNDLGGSVTYEISSHFRVNSIPNISSDTYLFSYDNKDFTAYPYLLFYIDDYNYFCYSFATYTYYDTPYFTLFLGYKNVDGLLNQFSYMPYLSTSYYSYIAFSGASSYYPQGNHTNYNIFGNTFGQSLMGNVFLQYVNGYSRSLPPSGNTEIYHNNILWFDNNNINAYDTGYSVGHSEGYDEGLQDGKDIGYEDGYRIGVVDGTNTGNTFVSLLLTIADIPVYILYHLTNFQLFGISVFVAIMSIITICLAVWILRKII